MKTYVLLISICILCNSCTAQSNNENIDKCKQQIIDEGLEVILVLDNRYVINGFIDTIFSEDLIEMSFFRLLDCKTGNNIVDRFFCTYKEDYNFCLPFKTQINRRGSNLDLLHYGRLPLGGNWSLIDVPVYKQTLVFSKDTIYGILKECILKPKSISRQQYENVLKEYTMLKNSKNIGYMDTDSVGMVILKLFLCSIDNYPKCEEYFLNLNKEIPDATDGLLGDIYWRWYGFYHLYKKLPLPEQIKEDWNTD